MKSTLSITIAAIASLALVPAIAPGKGKGGGGGKGGGKGPNKPKVSQGGSKGNSGKSAAKTDKGKGASATAKIDKWDDKKRGAAKFSSKDRDDLVSFWDQYKGNPNGLPPGLAKNLARGKPLPPGWQDKLRPGWRIDDEWWGRFERVPAEFLPKDIKLPVDTGMFLLGDRMVRVHEPTREVIDFLPVPTIKR
jgi:hypothetical protein